MHRADEYPGWQENIPNSSGVITVQPRILTPLEALSRQPRVFEEVLRTGAAIADLDRTTERAALEKEAQIREQERADEKERTQSIKSIAQKLYDLVSARLKGINFFLKAFEEIQHLLSGGEGKSRKERKNRIREIHIQMIHQYAYIIYSRKVMEQKVLGELWQEYKRLAALFPDHQSVAEIQNLLTRFQDTINYRYQGIRDEIEKTVPKIGPGRIFFFRSWRVAIAGIAHSFLSRLKRAAVDYKEFAQYIQETYLPQIS